MFKDYLDREFDEGKQDDYVELNCSKCGDTICYSLEDYSLEQMFCENCFDEVFPDENN